MRIRVMCINAGPLQTATIGSLIRLICVPACTFSLALVGMRCGRNASMQLTLFNTKHMLMRFVRSRVDIKIWTSVDWPLGHINGTIRFTSYQFPVLDAGWQYYGRWLEKTLGKPHLQTHRKCP